MLNLNGSPVRQNKSEMRAIFLTKRSQITSAERHRYSYLAADYFFASSLFLSSQHIACYLAMQDEPDCAPILDQIIKVNKKAYVPILLKPEKKLAFVSYHSGIALHPNCYHILEPDGSSFFPAEKLDVVILPLVGIDQIGNRLGRGGGYYDCTFFFRLNQRGDKPFLLGLAYEVQKIDHLPHDSWDVQLDGVLTEKGLVIF